MKNLLDQNELILLEGAIIERLRRSGTVQLHDMLAIAPLVYQEAGRQALTHIYTEYIQVAADACIPFFMCTPTWRADHSRVSSSNVAQSVNIDVAQFMSELRESVERKPPSIHIGGMIGCKNGCYRPEEGLNTTESETFHSWQIDQLAQGGVDFLLAETLPNVEEALGIAKAMEHTSLPYIISFVIARDGRILDGRSLLDAVKTIDGATDRPPIGYMVNCAYPTFLCAEQQPEELFSRLIGYQANASSQDHCDLDNATDLATEDLSNWGEAMLALHNAYGLRILGGCCGTGIEHLRYIVGGSIQENYWTKTETYPNE